MGARKEEENREDVKEESGGACFFSEVFNARGFMNVAGF